MRAFVWSFSSIALYLALAAAAAFRRVNHRPICDAIIAVVGLAIASLAVGAVLGWRASVGICLLLIGS
jgi:hypothetical protein